MYFLPVMGSGSPKSRCRLIWFPRASSIPGCRWLPSQCVLLRLGEREQASSFVSSRNNSNPTVEAYLMTSSNPNHLPKAPCSNATTMGVEASTYEFGVHKHSIHSKGSPSIPTLVRSQGRVAFLTQDNSFSGQPPKFDPF